MGEQLAALSKAATSGDNPGLLAAGKAIHEQMKVFLRKHVLVVGFDFVKKKKSRLTAQSSENVLWRAKILGCNMNFSL